MQPPTTLYSPRTLWITASLALSLWAPLAWCQEPSTEKGRVAEALAPFEGDFAEVRLGGRQQYLHRSGRVWVDKPEQYGAPVCIAIKNGAYGAINGKGDVIADFVYDRIYYEYDDMPQPRADREYLFFLAVIQLDGKLGAVDTLGTLIAPPIYEDLRPLNGHVIAARKAGKWGLLSLRDGHTVLPFTYDGLDKEYLLDGRIRVTLGNRVGLRSANGLRELIPPVYETVRVVSLSKEPLVAVTQDGQNRLLDTLGRVRAEGPYDHFAPAEDLIQVERNGKRGWLTADGAELFPPVYDASGEWQAGRNVVSQGTQKGLIAKDGTTVLPCQYEEIRMVEKPLLFLAKRAGKWGLFDPDGRPIIPFNHDDIQIVGTGEYTCVWAVDGERYRIFDLGGNELVPPRYRQPTQGYGPSMQGPAPAYALALSDGDRVGVYDLRQRKVIVEPEYQEIEWQLRSFIKATNRGSSDTAYEEPVSAYFDADGTQLIAPTIYLFSDAVDTDRYVVRTHEKGVWKTELFDRSGKRLYTSKDWEFRPLHFNRSLIPDSIDREIPSFQNQLLKASEKGNLFVDRQGREHRFEGFDYVGDFYGGRAVATKRIDQTEHIGIIDTAGNIVLPPVYNRFDKLYNANLIRVTRDGKMGLIDLNGKVRLNTQYDVIDATEHENRFKVCRGGKCGIIDTHGTTILPMEYERIQFHGSFYLVTAGGKSGFVALDGKVLVAPRYVEVRLNASYHGYFPALVQEGDHWTYIDLSETGQPFHITGKTKLGY